MLRHCGGRKPKLWGLSTVTPIEATPQPEVQPPSSVRALSASLTLMPAGESPQGSHNQGLSEAVLTGNTFCADLQLSHL